MAHKMKLEGYHLSLTHGFLPSTPPLLRLPAYYEPWEALCSDLHPLRVQQKLGSRVAQLPSLTTAYLVNNSEWRRAYVILGFIASAYIWGAQKPLERLPAQIAVPLVEVAKHLGMPPIATYAAQNLWNYRLLDPRKDNCGPENMSALTTFTDSEDESWFYALPTAIEARGAPIISLALDAISEASADKPGMVMKVLQQICDHIDALAALLPRMYEKCRRDFFYREIRPLLAGTTGAGLEIELTIYILLVVECVISRRSWL